MTTEESRAIEAVIATLLRRNLELSKENIRLRARIDHLIAVGVAREQDRLRYLEEVRVAGRN